MTEVIIIGGGIIGLTSAYYAAKGGFSVTLLERGKLACEASKNNAGLIVPSMYFPLPLSARFSEMIKWVLNWSSPVRINLRKVPIDWFAKFLLSRDLLMIKEYWKKLRKLGLKSLEYTEKLIKDEKIECEYRKGQILEVYSLEKNFKNAIEQAKELKQEGIDIEIIEKRELQKLEPNLSDIVVGGLLYKKDASLNPKKFSNQLGEIVKHMDIRVYENTEVKGFLLENDNIKGVITDKLGVLKADVFVIAAGPWTQILLKQLGLKLPIQPAKGYTITLSPSNTRINTTLMLEEVRIVASMDESGFTRLSGVLDLVGFNKMIPENRVKWMIRVSSRFLPYISKLSIKDLWAGLRPCSPDGLPVIGPLPNHPNLIVATGHCRFGLTFATITGILITELIRTGRLEKSLEFLSPKRVLIDHIRNF